MAAGRSALPRKRGSSSTVRTDGVLAAPRFPLGCCANKESKASIGVSVPASPYRSRLVRNLAIPAKLTSLKR